MNPLLALPLLITDVPFAVALTVATLVMTAPSPMASTTLEPATAEMFVTAPDPSTPLVLVLTMPVVGLSAPEPSVFSGETFLTLDTAPIGVSAPDIRVWQPATILITVAGINLTGPDPDISYGFVVSSTVPGYSSAPREGNNPAEHGRQLADTLNRLMQGKGNTTGTLTLVADVEKTYLRDDRLAPESVVSFDPMTANATTEYLVNGTMYVLAADRQARQWLITHANAASTDRTFRYTVFS